MCAFVSLNRRSRLNAFPRISFSLIWVPLTLAVFLGAFAIRDAFLYTDDSEVSDIIDIGNTKSSIPKPTNTIPVRGETQFPTTMKSPPDSNDSTQLHNASEWTATPETPYEVCFVTSVYASSAEESDHPPDVREIRDANPIFAFFAFTCMDDLDAPGWTKKKRTFGYKQFITQSRWAKLMGWKDEDVYGRQAVIYMDGFCGPKSKHSDRYKTLAKAIHVSEFGLFQNVHEIAKGPLDELDRILSRNKDILKNVEASKAWLQSQPDFRPEIPMYANQYIGYDPKNIHFQQAAQFFWDRYSLELDLWRDQPLWSYVLDHFHIVPVRLGTFKALFKEYYKQMGHGGHRYDATADGDADRHEEKQLHGD